MPELKKSYDVQVKDLIKERELLQVELNQEKIRLDRDRQVDIDRKEPLQQ